MLASGGLLEQLDHIPTDVATITVSDDDQQVRIVFPNGAWWQIKRRLTRGDRRRIDRDVQTEAVRFAKRLKDEGISLTDIGTSAASSDRVVINPDEDDAMLLQGSLAWSHGPKITREAIGERPEEEADVIVAVMRAAYTRTDAQKRGPSDRPLNGLAEKQD